MICSSGATMMFWACCDLEKMYLSAVSCSVLIPQAGSVPCALCSGAECFWGEQCNSKGPGRRFQMASALLILFTVCVLNAYILDFI